MFNDYIQHGWKLCAISPGFKGPRGVASKGWNEKENAISQDTQTPGAGLLHAYSGTCAIDVDDAPRATAFLRGYGIDLDLLLGRSDAVRISSGRANRAKLLYRIDSPLPSLALEKDETTKKAAIEFRCGTAEGKSVQDVLPPTLHPDTGKPYQWVGSWKQLPTLPDELKALWLKLLIHEKPDVHSTVNVPVSVNMAELSALLAHRNPSCGYDEWLRIGMAVHHESEGSDEGFALWNEWSSKGAQYPGAEGLRQHWVSFGRSPTPVTANSLRRSDTAVASDFDVVAVQENPITSTSPLDDPAPSASAFTFLSLAELFDRPEPSWLIPSTLPDSGLGAFWGQPGGGKTFLAVDTALTVALGHTWRGQKVASGSVLYIAAEDDRGVQMRFASGLAARGVSEAPIRVLPAAPVFTDDKQTAALLKVIQGYGKQALTFIDTLAAVAPGSDENSSTDMGKIIAFCQKIQRVTGGLVLLIHHEGKTAGKGLRGWSGLHGAFDVEWHITDEESHREMRISKMKNGAMNSVFSFSLIPVSSSCIVEWL